MSGKENCVGLIKFFRNDEWLEGLRNGLLYCNTPEYYRMADQAGVSDHHESCVHAYRTDRGDDPISLTVDGVEIGGLSALTHHGPGFKDHWLHCWMVLTFPSTLGEAQSLVDDIGRLRDEFGLSCAFISAAKIPEVVERIASSTSLQLQHGAVEYSEDKGAWSAKCKPKSYEYQREYRFLIGECPSISVKPKQINCAQGLSDLITSSPSIQFKNRDGNAWFSLTQDGVFLRHDFIPAAITRGK